MTERILRSEWLADGRMLVVHPDRAAITTFSASADQPPAVRKFGPHPGLSTATVSNGTLIITDSNGMTLWNPNDGTLVSTLPLAQPLQPMRPLDKGPPQSTFAASPDRKWVAGVGLASLWVWDVLARKLVHEQIDAGGRVVFTGPRQFVVDRTVQIAVFDLTKRAFVFHRSTGGIGMEDWMVSRDGRWRFSFEPDFGVFNMETGKQLGNEALLLASMCRRLTLSFTTDSSAIAARCLHTCNDGDDNCVSLRLRTISLPSGAVTNDIELPPGDEWGSFSSDGQRGVLELGRQATLYTLDKSTPQRVAEIGSGRDGLSFELSNDGKLVRAIADDGSGMWVWSWPDRDGTPEQLLSLP